MGNGRLLAGTIALVAIALLLGGAAIGLLVEAFRDPAGVSSALDARLGGIVRFTVLQAVLSTVVSIGPAILVASALYNRRRFPGRSLLLALFAVPLGLPQIVAAIGILAFYGRAGYLADAATAAGLGQWPGIYGLGGILLAHAFFNVPLATRLILEALVALPEDGSRLAAQLGMRRGDRFRLIEWPVIRGVLPGVAGLVLMLCITSFTIVLVLGGGPGATTLEVAIYQALRFEFEPASAAVLTGVQIALTATLVAALTLAGGMAKPSGALSVVARALPLHDPSGRLADALLLAVAAAFVAVPIVCVFVAGLGADLVRLSAEASVRRALATSLAISTAAGALSLCLAIALVVARHAAEEGAGRPGKAIFAGISGPASTLVLVVPPIVLGAGWFLLLRKAGDPTGFAAPLIVAVNAAMAMPFAMRVLEPAWRDSAARHDRLARALGIRGLARLRLIDWPAMRRPAGVAFAVAMALSLGDLGVVALFGSDSVQTLPYLLLQRMGSYRTQDAAGLALMLSVLCLVLMLLADLAGRRRDT